MVVATQQGALLAGQFAHFDPFKLVSPAGWRIQTAEDVHAGGLARTARTHDRHELALIDPKINAAQGLHGRLACAVDLGHPLELNEGIGCLSISKAFMLISLRADDIDHHRHARLDLAGHNFGHASVCRPDRDGDG